MHQRSPGGAGKQRPSHSYLRPLARTPQAGAILVIDDCPAIVALLATLLGEIEGYPVRTAQSARAAIQASDAAATGAPPDPPALILLDLRLPGESSAESVRLLRERAGWAASPVIISSGHQHIATLACELDADGYLAKPFDLDAVSALARRYVLRAEAPALGARASAPRGCNEATLPPDDTRPRVSVSPPPPLPRSGGNSAASPSPPSVPLSRAAGEGNAQARRAKRGWGPRPTPKIGFPHPALPHCGGRGSRVPL